MKALKAFFEEHGIEIERVSEVQVNESRHYPHNFELSLRGAFTEPLEGKWKSNHVKLRFIMAVNPEINRLQKEGFAFVLSEPASDPTQARGKFTLKIKHDELELLEELAEALKPKKS